jgi:hypothetical protein
MPIRLKIYGLQDPGPYVTITGSCTDCRAEIHSTTLDVTKDDNLSAEFMALGDAILSMEHKCKKGNA